MKTRIPKRQQDTANADEVLAQFCLALDRSIPTLRTALLAGGVIGAAARVGQTADYLFVTGLLFHWAMWFENWWCSRRAR
jgi:hypothetical protein